MIANVSVLRFSSNAHRMLTAMIFRLGESTEPTRGNYNLTACTALLKYAQDRNISFRGHNLVSPDRMQLSCRKLAKHPPSLRKGLAQSIAKVASR